MHYATKRLEIEILIKAGLSNAGMVGIAGVSVQTVLCDRAETEARSAVADGIDAMTVSEVLHGQAEAGPPGGGPGRPSKTVDYRELVASILTAQPGLFYGCAHGCPTELARMTYNFLYIS